MGEDNDDYRIAMWVRHLVIDKLRFEKLKVLRLLNEKIRDELKNSGEIRMSYSCQKCQEVFVSREFLNITCDVFPLCDVCNGKIQVDTATEERVIKEAKEEVGVKERIKNKVGGK